MNLIIFGSSGHAEVLAESVLLKKVQFTWFYR